MAYEDHLKQRIEDLQRRIQKRKEQQTFLGPTVDPSVPIEIENHEKECEQLRTDLAEHRRLLDLFTRYERGLERLFNRISSHERGYDEALRCRSLLQEHMEQVRKYGDTPTDIAERDQIVGALSAAAEAMIGKSFYTLSGIVPGGHADGLPPPASPVRPSIGPPKVSNSGIVNTSIASMKAQNIVWGDNNNVNNITNNASYQNNYYGPVGQTDALDQAIGEPQSVNDSLESRMAALTQAIQARATPALSAEALRQVAGLKHALNVIDIAHMASVLDWFERQLPMLAGAVRAQVCHPSVTRAVRTQGVDTLKEYQRRFGQLNGSQEPRQ